MPMWTVGPMYPETICSHTKLVANESLPFETSCSSTPPGGGSQTQHPADTSTALLSESVPLGMGPGECWASCLKFPHHVSPQSCLSRGPKGWWSDLSSQTKVPTQEHCHPQEALRKGPRLDL